MGEPILLRPIVVGHIVAGLSAEFGSAYAAAALVVMLILYCTGDPLLRLVTFAAMTLTHELFPLSAITVEAGALFVCHATRYPVDGSSVPSTNDKTI